jgi:tripartite-type tricarboxylate transporter receptor subunit TctC
LLSLIFAVTAAAALAASLSGAAAQEPGRTITIIVPYTAGTGPDILARLIGEALHQRFRQPVIVENKPGASGNIGTEAAARAAPDGHTLLLIASPFTQNVALFKTVPYDPVKSFAPIVMVAEGSVGLAINRSMPVTSTKMFIDYVKAHPGQVNYASPGRGTPQHLAMELFKLATGIDVKHVPYKGSPAAIQDVVGGHVSAMFVPIHVGLPLAQDNQIRLLAVASKERVKVAPDTPTLLEQGIYGVEIDFWFGMLAPAGTPQETVARYNSAVNEIIRSPQIADKMTIQGLVPLGGSAEQFAEYIPKDLAKWRKVIEAAGLATE